VLFHSLHESLLDDLDLFLQRLHDRQIGLHRERHIGRKTESADLRLIQTLDRFALHLPTCLA